MKKQILIVDDSAIMRSIVKKAIQLSGLDVGSIEEAKNGAEALQILNDSSIDLVFTDLNMPGMGGDVLIQQMSQSELLRDIPVVIVSTEGSETRLNQLCRPGVVSAIRKPFTPEQFRETMDVLFQLN